MIYLVIAITF